MKTIIHHLAPVLIFFLCSCQKELCKIETTKPVDKPTVFLKGPQTQEFNFTTAELPFTITTKNGSTITIPKDAFTIKGFAATGNVVFSVQEFVGKGEMIAAGINTMNNGQMLVSDGSFNISASVDGMEADKQLAALLYITVPKNSNEGSDLYEGESITGANNNMVQFNWRMIEGRAKNSNNNLIFNWGKLGWINCDQLFSGTAALTTTKVDLPNNPGNIAGYLDSSNTYVFFIPRGINSAVQLYTHTNNWQVTSYEHSMPVGMQGMLLGFCIKHEQCWFTKKEITITENWEDTLMLQSSTAAEIQAQINLLNKY